MKNKTTNSRSNKSSARRSPSSETIDVNKNTSASIRQIENGYLVSESGYTGKGKNQQYFSREYFSKTNPVANVKLTFANKSK